MARLELLLKGPASVSNHTWSPTVGCHQRPLGKNIEYYYYYFIVTGSCSSLSVMAQHGHRLPSFLCPATCAVLAVRCQHSATHTESLESDMSRTSALCIFFYFCVTAPLEPKTGTKNDTGNIYPP